MEVVCDECGKKGAGSLGDLLVAGWVQKNAEVTPTRRGWLCPACVMTIQARPTSPPISGRKR